MLYRRFSGALAVFFSGLTLMAAGCGGGGGGGTAPIRPSTNVIAETAGNTWNYNISGTATPTGGGSAQPVTGTATATITSSTFNGVPNTLGLQLVSNISINGGASTPITITWYFTQDVNNNVIMQGQTLTDSSGTNTKIVSSPSLATSELFPGTFSQGEQISETTNFTDTTSQTYVFSVGAPAQVNTPAGTFNVWPSTITIGGLAGGTQDWDPALGAFVSGNVVSVAQVGATQYRLNVNYSLTSDSI